MSADNVTPAPSLLDDLPKPSPLPDALKASYPELAKKFTDIESLAAGYASLESEHGKLRRQVPKAPDAYPTDIVPEGMTVTPELWQEFKAANMNAEQAKIALAKIHGQAASSIAAKAETRAKENDLMHRDLMAYKGFANRTEYDAWRIGLKSWANANLSPAQISEFADTVHGMKAIEAAMIQHVKSGQVPEGGLAPAPSRSDVQSAAQTLSDRLWKDPSNQALQKEYNDAVARLAA